VFAPYNDRFHDADLASLRILQRLVGQTRLGQALS
jgi:hypothetical protein